jgi:FixJ family two-component response regulator
MTMPPTVHVVGDEAVVRHAVAALFSLGYDVACWNSGAQFLAGPIPGAEDFILLDFAVGGGEVLERLRAWNVTTPVIAMVVPEDRRPESALIEGGAVWVLRRPFSTEEVRRALTIAQAAGARLRRALGGGYGCPLQVNRGQSPI